MADYVYAIVESSFSAPSGPGLGGKPVRLVSNDDLAALVSDLGDGHLEMGRNEILSHSRVLEGALGSGAVLPMRFGVVMPGDEEVRSRLLEDHDAEIREQLTRFRGKVEINIRATYDEQMLLREVVAGNPEIERLRDAVRSRPEAATYYERIELGERAAQAVEQRREVDARNLIGALSQVCDAVEASPPAHERVALNASFLVERDRLGEFDEVLEAFAEGQGGRLRFKYTGPLPPHSFVQFTGGG